MHITTSGRSGHAYDRPFMVRAEARRVALAAPAPALGLGEMLPRSRAQLGIEAAHRLGHAGPAVLGRPADGLLAEAAALGAVEQRGDRGGQRGGGGPRAAPRAR